MQAKSVNMEEEWRGGSGPGSQREEPGGAPPRRDRVYKHERDAEADGESDGDRNELERGLEAGEVGLVRGRPGLLLLHEREEAAVREARGQLE